MEDKETNEPQKKMSLISAAQQLMLEKGYVATTVDDICCEAGVTKGSFFYYFKSKEELGKEVVERFSGHIGELMQKSVDGVEDPLDRVYCTLDFVIEMSKDPEMKGCLVGKFSQELTESQSSIRCVCSNSFEMNLKNLQKDLAAAKKKYAPKSSSIEVVGLAEMFLSLCQGAMILMKAKEDRAVIERTLKHYKHYLKNLFGR